MRFSAKHLSGACLRLLLLCVAGSYGLLPSVGISTLAPCMSSGSELLLQPGANCTVNCSVIVICTDRVGYIDLYDVGIGTIRGSTATGTCDNGTNMKTWYNSIEISDLRKHHYIQCVFEVNYVRFYSKTLIVKVEEPPSPSSSPLPSPSSSFTLETTPTCFTPVATSSIAIIDMMPTPFPDTVTNVVQATNSLCYCLPSPPPEQAYPPIVTPSVNGSTTRPVPATLSLVSTSFLLLLLY